MALSKITNLSITDDAVRTVGIQDDNITTAKILDNNVTLAKLGDGTQGDVLYYGASGAPARLGFGTSGDFLKTQGTGANPVWATVGGIDCDADAWARIAPVTDQDVAAVLDWETSVHMGSNITESGGVITVGTAGWYLIGIHISNQSAFADNMDMLFRKNSTAVLGKTYWQGNTEINYLGMQSTVIVECSADDTLDVYGTGYYTGDTVASTSLTWFTGVRLGA